ncbi:MAG: ATP-binding protein [Chloroflexota bacterium]
MTRAKTIVLMISEAAFAQSLQNRVLKPGGYQVEVCGAFAELRRRLQLELPNALIIDDTWGAVETDQLLKDFPALAVVLALPQADTTLEVKAYQRGFRGVVAEKDDSVKILMEVNRAVQYQQSLERWITFETRRNTRTLQRRVDDLERLHAIGGKITASLDLDQVLKEVVEAAVELTQAEEGNILLYDEESGELVLRASYTAEEGATRTLRIPVQDTLIGEVLERRTPVVISGDELQKIQTAFLVRALIYVPLILGEEAVGVLGVFNRKRSQTFDEVDRTRLEALADYAAIAIQNARLFSENELERNKLHTILTQVQDGVLVLDQNEQVLLINRACLDAFHLTEEEALGRQVTQVIANEDLQIILQQSPPQRIKGGEVRLEDGRVWNCQVTAIPEVGMVITMQDISHLKELDRVKSEFVSTVSHDLRSPLTAILGYTELIGRVGPLNERQQEFIRRVQASVQGITALISDLLDLGRIEAGLDARKELLDLQPLIRHTIENLSGLVAQKEQELRVEVKPPLAMIWGNAVRIQQMLANLISNAVKYTPAGGKLGLRAWQEGEQVILQVWDTGQGIPLSEQPYIFDKFFRGSNLPEDVAGTGLGLTIVKSIVEDHQGRIWVESQPGNGTTFTVVLPGG